MGSSTGNLLVDKDAALAALFAESPVLIATHCEDEGTIRANIQRFREEYGDRATAALHPSIRSAEACYRSSAKAVELADRYGADLHILHLSTARELIAFRRPTARGKKDHQRSVRTPPLVHRCRLRGQRQPDQMESG